MTGGHGGHVAALARVAGRPVSALLDFSANINPLGAPDWVRGALHAAADQLEHYPDPDCTALTGAIAAHLGLAADRIVPGNGAEQLIWWLPRLLAARRVVLPSPCYRDYARAAAVWGLPVEPVALDRGRAFVLDPAALAAVLRPGDLVWVGQPANPSGRITDPEGLRAAVIAAAEVHWAIDEAFIDFVADVPSAVHWDLPNLVVLRSMTKFYALPALRLGYAVLPAVQAAVFRSLLPDWSVNAFAQQAGIAALMHPERADHAARTRRLVAEERAWLAERLRALGIGVIDGAANYLLLRLPERAPAAPLLARRLLMADGIAVRVCTDYTGLDARDLRIAVRLRGDNARLLAALAAALRA